MITEILLILVVVGLGIGVFISMNNKHRKFYGTIRNLTGSKQILVKSICAEIKDAKGVSKLFIKKYKEYIEMPPDDAIQIDNKGHCLIEMYRDRYSNYAYVCDKGIQQFRHPINTNQQILLADQIIRAHSKKTDWKQHLPMIAGLSFVAIVFVAFLLLVGEPLKLLQGYQASTLTQVTDLKTLDLNILDSYNNIRNDIQIIKAQVGVDNNTAPN